MEGYSIHFAIIILYFYHSNYILVFYSFLLHGVARHLNFYRLLEIIAKPIDTVWKIPDGTVKYHPVGVAFCRLVGTCLAHCTVSHSISCTSSAHS